MWKRRRRYRDRSYRYPSQPYDNEKQYYGGFASGRPYIKSNWQIDDFKMPYSYRPPKPPTWSPNRKYPNPYVPKLQLKKYDDTVPEIHHFSAVIVPREYAEPSMKLYQPGYERHLVAFKKSSERIKNYKQKLQNKQLRKDIHNRIWSKLGNEYKRIDKIMASGPFIDDSTRLPALEGRTAKEMYAPIEDKENTKLITYREGDTMTVAQAIRAEEEESVQPQSVWVVPDDDDENNIAQQRAVEHLEYKRVKGNNLLNQKRNENYIQQQQERDQAAHNAALEDEAREYFNQHKMSANERNSMLRSMKRQMMDLSMRSARVKSDEVGHRVTVNELRRQGKVPVPRYMAKYFDQVENRRQYVDESHQLQDLFTVEEPVDALVVANPNIDGAIADSSKSIKGPKEPNLIED